MIHYFGTPLGGKRIDVSDFLFGRHAFVSFIRPEDIGVAAEVCDSFALDNGAFTAWKSGEPITDWSEYYSFVDEWRRHPGFDWAIMPDVINGTEKDNDDLLAEWPWDCDGVPVYHFHESLERLERLVCSYNRIALGSSGDFPDPGTDSWWHRLNQIMDVCCDERGRPRTKLHGLRMLDPAVFHRIPLASADSTNIARNGHRKAQECKCSLVQGRELIAERIEIHNSAAIWKPLEQQKYLAFMRA